MEPSLGGALPIKVHGSLFAASLSQTIYLMGLEVAFQSRDLRGICESPARAKRELGEAAGAVLRRHLADLEAVETVAELFEMGLGFENCAHKLGLVRFQLDDDLYLYSEVNHRNVPMNGEQVDWTKVTRLKVVHVGSAQ